jgi:DNA-binding beta-propeller fold protein YncE
LVEQLTKARFSVYERLRCGQSYIPTRLSILPSRRQILVIQKQTKIRSRHQIKVLKLAEKHGAVDCRQAVNSTRTCFKPSTTDKTMKTIFFKRWPHLAGMGFLLALLLNGCTTATPKKTNYTFFPPAPDEPRVQFLTSFSGDTDLGRSSGFQEYITGVKSAAPLEKPYGLALNDGKVFVCDTVKGVVQIFDLKKQRASYFAPQGEGRMKMPFNLSVDEDGTRYIVDTLRNQVLIYTKDGEYVTAIGKKDEFKPTDVVVTTNRLFITDLHAHCVKVYDKTERSYLFSIPASTNVAKQTLYSPVNMALDKVNNRLLVSDISRFAIQIYDLEGKYLDTIGQQGLGMGSFARPKGVAVDREGIAYVVDASVQLVQMFDKQGRLLMYFGQPGASTRGQLTLPAAVKIDYKHLDYFSKYVAPGFKLDYVILVTSQFGENKVSVYGFLKKK